MPASEQSQREQRIPVRKSELLDALIEHGTLRSPQEEAQFRRIAWLLAVISHHEFFDHLSRLHEAYHHLDPDRAPRVELNPATEEQDYLVLRDALLAGLRGANFMEVPRSEIEHAHEERAAVRVRLRTSLDEFREVRFFGRGLHRETLTVSDWYGLRKRRIEADVYDDVVMLCGMKPASQLKPNGKRRRKREPPRRLRPGSVMIRSFRHIASADLNALYPNARIVMGTLDRLFLTIPAIAGGVPIILNLVSTVTVLFLVAGFYLGLSGAVNDNDLKKALAATSGLIALGAFIMRQWMRYQRQSLLYQKELAENIYYRNVSNNAGLFDSLIGAAEEQECKEAFLACYFLLDDGAPATPRALDTRIEQWLAQKFGIAVDFDVDDALGKLERLGLAQRAGDTFTILPMAEMQSRLETVWTGMINREAGFSPQTRAAGVSPG